MFRRKTILATTLFLFLTATPSWSKVFIRWTEASVPPATSMGVDALVVPLQAKLLIVNARKAGYRVYVEVPISRVSSAASSPVIAKLGGIFLAADEANRKQTD